MLVELPAATTIDAGVLLEIGRFHVKCDDQGGVLSEHQQGAISLSNDNPPAERSDTDPRLTPPANDVRLLVLFTAVIVLLAMFAPRFAAAQGVFTVEEATIADVHAERVSQH